MANPNLLAATTATGRMALANPGDTVANVILTNPLLSGEVFKINNIVAANVDGTNAVDVTVSIHNAAAGGGTAYPIVSTVSVPADASLIVADKTTGIYILENASLTVTSGTASGIAYTISYEVIA
tara:strand:+ start:2082 stop:2456 length:375 start_codon:yes stop_codon:yes gene_type:complete